VWNLATLPSLLAQLGWVTAISIVLVRRRSGPRFEVDEPR
jgi:hypothetical protein